MIRIVLAIVALLSLYGCALWRRIDVRAQTVAASDMRPVPVVGGAP